MADLSQDEIDALISGTSSEEESVEPPVEKTDSSVKENPKQEKEEVKEKNLRKYDFKKPSPIPEEQKNTIALLHEHYAQKLKVNLSAFLRTEVETSIENVEQITFSAYISSLNTPTCISSFDMSPLNGFGLIEVNAIIAYSVIDRMLGGNGSPPKQVRPFTDVEISIIRKFIGNLLTDLQDTWKSVVNVSFSPREIQTNPAMVRIIPMREITLIITLGIKISDANGLITICIPYSNLEPISFKLGNQQWTKYTSKPSEDVLTAHKRNFYKVPLEVNAILGQIELGIEEIIALEVGDIIDLSKKTKDPIHLQIAGSNKFEANPGLLGKHKAAIIKNDIKKD